MPDSAHLAFTALKLLWGRPLNEEENRYFGSKHSQFERELLAFAGKNVVVLRLGQAWEKSGLTPCPALALAGQQERSRIRSAFELIGRIGSVLEKTGEEFVFSKSLIHYPDMGHDIDLLLPGKGKQPDRELIRQLAAVAEDNSLLNAVAGKTGYRIPGYPLALEIHHGLFGHLGEYRDYAGQIVRRRAAGQVTGLRVWVPSPEDQLLICVLQRIYGHFHIRASDILLVAALSQNSDLDWDYLCRQAGILGVRESLEYLYDYCAAVYYRCTGAALPVLPWRKNKSGAAAVRPQFSRGVFRFPFTLALKGYALKMVSAFLRGDLHQAGRLSALPLLAGWSAVSAVFRRLIPRGRHA